VLVLLVAPCAVGAQPPSIPQEVLFPSGDVTLRGTLYKPEGEGPFPALVYNHGSAPGNLNDLAFTQLGPLFAQRGWVFFAPYRRGQGLSAEAGPYVGDEIASVARESVRGSVLAVVLATIAIMAAVVMRMRGRRTSLRASSATAVGLAGAVAALMIGANARNTAVMQVLQASQLTDHLAAYQWLKGQRFVNTERMATAGNSFGGIITVLAAKQVPYCAAIDGAGGAETWSGPVATGMIEAVRQSQAPIFFFQAANDYSIEPTQQLGEEMRKAQRAYEAKIYPAFGTSSADGHSFAWRGSAVWAEDVFRFLNANCS